jgi:hypothetical protein
VDDRRLNLLSQDSKTTLIYGYNLLQSTSCPSTSREAVRSHHNEALRGYHQSINMGSVLLPLPLIPSLLSPPLTQSTASGQYTGIARLWCVPSPRCLCSGCPASVITVTGVDLITLDTMNRACCGRSQARKRSQEGAEIAEATWTGDST